MIKVAILGSENSHCAHFASVLAPKDGNKVYDDVELIGIYGEPGEPGVTEGNEAAMRMSTCEVFADDKDAFLQEADAIMVTARNGSKHLKYAENYIKKGIPVWIDKPITCSVSEALNLMELSEQYGAVLSGGSALEFHDSIKKYADFLKEKNHEILGAHITAPVNMDNPYGGFWFYAQHLVAMIITVFGTDMKSVRAMKTDNGVHAIYNYDTFTVSAFFGTGYSVTLYTDAFSSISESFDLPEDFYKAEIETFYNVIKTGKPDKTKRDYIAPVCILEATIESYEKNKEININIPFIEY